MQSAVWECRQAPDELLEWLHARMASAKHVESVVRSSEKTLDVTSACVSGGAILGAILLFPIGLVLLLLKSRRVLHFRAEPSGTGTRLYIDGGVAPGVKTALVECWQALQAQQAVTAAA